MKIPSDQKIRRQLLGAFRASAESGIYSSPAAFQGVGISKAIKWECRACGAENKSIRKECAKCGHEPVLGRRDFSPEGRKYDPSSED